MSTFEQQIEAALRACLNPLEIKNAEAALAKLYKKPAAIPALFTILANHPEPALRQLAAVELRKRIMGGYKEKPQWPKVDQAQREEIKAGLLHVVENKPGKKIITSSSRTIAAIATTELANNTWPQLSNWVLTLSRSADPESRETGLDVLSNLLSDTFQSFRPAMPQLIALLSENLVYQQSLGVRVAAYKCLREILDSSPALETDEKQSVQAVFALLPQIFEVVKQSVASGEESYYEPAIDIGECLMMMSGTFVTAEIFAQLIELLLSIATTKEFEEDARNRALAQINLVIRFKKGKFAALGPDAISQFVDRVLQLPCEEEEPEDPEDTNPVRGAYETLDVIATYLPPSHFAPRLFTRFQELMASPNPRHRRTALLALNQVIEGCCIYLSDHLDGLWPYLEQGLRDTDAGVAKASCMAFASLCEWLSESVAEHHERFLPLILARVDSPDTQRLAMSALDAFLECLGETIKVYLDGLMQRLVVLLDSPDENIRGVTIAAIASAAHAAKADFTPYFETVMQRIVPLLLKKESADELKLRGLCQDSIGTMAEAVGRDHFRPYYDDMMRVSFEAIMLDEAQLTETSYTFFGVMSRVFKEEFKPALPAVVQALLKSLVSDDGGVSTTLLTAGDEAEGGDDEGDDGFEDIEVGADDDEDEDFGVPAAAIEKAVAADVLGELFIHMGLEFKPYIEPAIEGLTPCLDHYIPVVVRNASDALLSFISSMQVALLGTVEYTPGAQNIAPLAPEVAAIADRVMPLALKMFEEEEDPETVRALIDSVSRVIHEVGPAVIFRPQPGGGNDSANFDQICHHLLLILQGKAPCQVDEDEPDQMPELRSENDAVLVGSAADLVGTLATALGTDFAQAFATFMPGMLEHFYGPERQVVDRSAAVAAMAEVINGMQSGITQFTQPMLKLGLDTLTDSSIEIQSNGAWLVSSLVFWSDNDLSSTYPNILSGLQPILQYPDGKSIVHNNAKDNACGAIARLILKNVSAVPLEQVLPVWIGALPLRRDYVEYDKIVLSLGKLLESGQVSQYLDHILQVFAHALRMTAEAKTEDDGTSASLPMKPETQAALVTLLKQIPQEKLAAAGLEGALHQ